MPERKCFVHIGTHKTGTTSIQRLLAANQRHLMNYGLYVPVTGRPAGYDGHHNIAWQLNDDPRFELSSGTLSDLARELEAVALPTVCVSSEDFEYLHAKPERLRLIRDAIASTGYVAKIILYLRSQPDYERSLYTELVKHGITETAEEFHKQIVRHQVFQCHDRWIFQFAYDRLIHPFAETFGVENIIIHQYRSTEPDWHLLTDFLRIVLPGDQQLNVADFELPPRMNRSTPV